MTGMPRDGLTRRELLILPLALPFIGAGVAAAEIQARKGTYTVDVALLYATVMLRLTGTIDETVDRVGGRYDVRLVGEGAGIANRVESSGRWQDGRWAPLRSTSWFQVRGRESRSEVLYDYGRAVVDYRFRGETFFMRRLRVVDDSLTLPNGVRVDDVMSAILNYADGAWKPDADGLYQTHVVRRRRNDGEGPDDVDPQPRAEFAPLELRITTDEATGKPTGLFDMTRFSSWAKKHKPARIVFGPSRRPELITSSLMLGTSVTIRLHES